MPDRSGWDRQPGFELAGRRALVVGVETASGAAIARGLAQAGASVAAIATGGDPGTVSRLGTDLGAGSVTGVWDVTRSEAIEAGLAALSGGFGVPSVLVTACDAYAAAPIEQTDDATYRRVMALVVDAPYFLCRAFLRALPAETANPRIIMVTNVFGERGIDNLSAYAAAQGAVQNLVRALAQELGARNGATVNGIATGWMTDTPGRGPDEIGQNRLMRFVPMRRFGAADEVAPLAVLLASAGAGYISGQILHVDGGITTHL